MESTKLVFTSTSIAFGIQLGTSCYRVSQLTPESSSPEIVLDAFGNEATPAYFGVDDGILLYGDDAKNYACIHPENCLKGVVKGFVNAPATEAESDVQPNSSARQFTVKNLRLDNALCGTIKALTPTEKQELQPGITLPFIVFSIANIYLASVEERISKLANGLTEKDHQIQTCILVPKTTAAFAGFAMSRETCADGVYAVICVGASVTELAVYGVQNGVAVRNVEPVSYYFGGDDFDDVLVEHCCKQFKAQYSIDLKMHSGALERLRQQCQKARDRLSAAKVVVIEIPRLVHDFKFRLHINRTDMEKAMENKTSGFSDWLCKEMANIKDPLAGVILVGAASRIPVVQNIVNTKFPGLVQKSIIPYAHMAAANGSSYISRYAQGQSSEFIKRLKAGYFDLHAMRLRVKGYSPNDDQLILDNSVTLADKANENVTAQSTSDLTEAKKEPDGIAERASSATEENHESSNPEDRQLASNCAPVEVGDSSSFDTKNFVSRSDTNNVNGNRDTAVDNVPYPDRTTFLQEPEQSEQESTDAHTFLQQTTHQENNLIQSENLQLQELEDFANSFGALNICDPKIEQSQNTKKNCFGPSVITDLPHVSASPAPVSVLHYRKIQLHNGTQEIPAYEWWLTTITAWNYVLPPADWTGETATEPCSFVECSVYYSPPFLIPRYYICGAHLQLHKSDQRPFSSISLTHWSEYGTMPTTIWLPSDHIVEILHSCEPNAMVVRLKSSFDPRSPFLFQNCNLAFIITFPTSVDKERVFSRCLPRPCT
ncbi:heat shock 70 kDa protein-like [Paramacrobiotus metropolitanus]|uniref:heat shock 70 kDa protein-like n=1 Tax=Paramacrobiotus metropolitanus TaxID=2943436 RepID=UPI002445E00F|nr:heat shock 70 kDa protein-like [Paramacrobiotus metropolitanus]